VILAAGLTPAWQQILTFDAFQPGQVNRAKTAVWCASGKVLNVGMAIHSLGGPVQTLSLLGGLSGEAIRQEFAQRNVPARWIDSKTPTRVCTTILEESSGQTTELVENSAPLHGDELDQFRRAFREQAATAEWVVLSGSLPAGVSHDLYNELMRDCSGRVILDIRGEELTKALEQKPFLVKPNREELAKTVGRELSTEAETWAAMKELNRQGAEWVVITQGPDAVLASQATGAYRFIPPRLPVVNPIGCGDCLAAGLAWAFHAGLRPLDALQFGIAAAADNLGQLLPARLDPDRVRNIADSVSYSEQPGGA